MNTTRNWPKFGQRCLRYAMVGHRVCHQHYQAIVRAFHRERKE